MPDRVARVTSWSMSLQRHVVSGCPRHELCGARGRARDGVRRGRRGGRGRRGRHGGRAEPDARAAAALPAARRARPAALGPRAARAAPAARRQAGNANHQLHDRMANAVSCAGRPLRSTFTPEV